MLEGILEVDMIGNQALVELRRDLPLKVANTPAGLDALLKVELPLAIRSSPSFSFLFNPSELCHIGFVGKTSLLLLSPLIKCIIPLVRHLNGLFMTHAAGTRQHLIKV